MKKSLKALFSSALAVAMVTGAMSVSASAAAWGDVNGSGACDAEDAALTLQYTLRPADQQVLMYTAM